jgi:hypothetical protein
MKIILHWLNGMMVKWDGWIGVGWMDWCGSDGLAGVGWMDLLVWDVRIGVVWMDWCEESDG